MGGRRFSRAAGDRLGATTGFLLIFTAIAAPAQALETTTLRAAYAITVSGVLVGHARVESRFSDMGYVAAINGSTSGVSRLVTDATARLSGSGRVVGTEVLGKSYSLDTHENGFATHVNMMMQGGTIT